MDNSADKIQYDFGVTISELQFVEAVESGHTNFVFETKDHWACDTPLIDYDFSKEIILPGVFSDRPEGLVQIRVDDDFWIVAVLPYSWRTKSIQSIVQLLWPTVGNATYKDDTYVTEAE